MSRFFQTLNALGFVWSGAMWRACWQGGLAVVLAWVVCRVAGNRLPVAARPWLWRLALLKFVLAFVALPSLRLPLLPNSVTLAQNPDAARQQDKGMTRPRAAQQPADASRSLPPAIPFPRRHSDRGERAASPSAAASGRLNPLPSRGIEGSAASSARGVEGAARSGSAESLLSNALGLLLLAWLGGVTWSLARIGRDRRRTGALVRGCTPVQQPAVEAICGALCRTLKIARAPRLLRVESGTPLLVGLRRPAIVLPSAMLDGGSEAELRLVLAHELAHLQRRDLAWNILVSAAGALFFFHPMLWLARREWQLAQEMACDEAALQATGEAASAYGAMLLRIAARRSAPHASFSTVGVVDDFATLRRRLLAMQARTALSRRQARLWAALLLPAALISLLPWRVTAQEQAASAASRSPAATARPSVIPASQREITGRVMGPDGQSVSGATVYLMRIFHSGQPPLALTTTDAKGQFRLHDAPLESLLETWTGAEGRTRMGWGHLIVDAGKRGFWFSDVQIKPGQPIKPALVRMPATSTLEIVFRDSRGRAVPHLGVRLSSMSRDAGYWLALPPTMLPRLRGRADAQGRCTFINLPQGLNAQPTLADERRKPSQYGDGDRRGGRFAPLSTEDTVWLRHAVERKTIHLLPPTTVSGRVFFGPTGKPVAGSRVLARRINAQEARGDTAHRDYVISTTQADKSGRYTLNGLRPGNYVLWTWPSKALSRDWTSVNPEATLLAGKANRVDFKLIKGAIIEGRVVSAITGLPVPHQTMGLFDAEENYQYETSRKDGSFRFRAVGGKQHLWVHANGASPPPGFMLPVKKEFDFKVANGQTYRITIRLPVEPVFKPITGRVVDENGNAVAGAQVNVEKFGDYRENGIVATLTTDQAGRFRIEAKTAIGSRRLIADRNAAGPLRLTAEATAEAGKRRMTARGVIALNGDEVTLRIEPNVAAIIAGRVTDEGGQPVVGATVHLRHVSGNIEYGAGEVKTGTDGRFTFSRQQPTSSYTLSVAAPGFASFGRGTEPPGRGATIDLPIVLHRASSFVAGRVLLPNGSPAEGFQVNASGSDRSVKTDAAGRFRIPHTLAGDLQILVWNSDSVGRDFKQFKAKSGKTDVVLRLTSKGVSRIDYDWKGQQARVAALVGLPAPEIAAASWVNSSPLALRGLRGKIVLLDFFYGPDAFISPRPEVEEIAQGFGPRGLQVIGIHMAPITAAAQRAAEVPPRSLPPFDAEKLRFLAHKLDLTYPLALDQPSTSPAPDLMASLGLTFARYQGAASVVVDRQGRIAYAGDSLSDAMRVVAGLLAQPMPVPAR